MIFTNKSVQMLKYEKARAKLVEFSVPADKYPNFPLDSTDLILTTIYALSKYSERASSLTTSGKAFFLLI